MDIHAEVPDFSDHRPWKKILGYAVDPYIRLTASGQNVFYVIVFRDRVQMVMPVEIGIHSIGFHQGLDVDLIRPGVVHEIGVSPRIAAPRIAFKVRARASEQGVGKDQFPFRSGTGKGFTEPFLLQGAQHVAGGIIEHEGVVGDEGQRVQPDDVYVSPDEISKKGIRLIMVENGDIFHAGFQSVVEPRAHVQKFRKPLMISIHPDEHRGVSEKLQEHGCKSLMVGIRVFLGLETGKRAVGRIAVDRIIAAGALVIDRVHVPQCDDEVRFVGLDVFCDLIFQSETSWIGKNVIVVEIGQDAKAERAAGISRRVKVPLRPPYPLPV